MSQRFFSAGAAIATSAVGASPEAFLELSPPPNQRTFYQNGDEIRGALSLEVPSEINHQGIKVILRGIIFNKSNEVYFGQATGGIITPGKEYEFIQLTR